MPARIKKQTVSRKTEVATKVTKPEAVKAPRIGGLHAPMYSLAGRVSGLLNLPKEIFGADVNEKLLAQAVRVYSSNQKKLLASTKTRGEVQGSTAKIYRQKGTGRARHGSIRAPIFVGGGIVFGPKPRKVVLGLPKNMRKKALFSALSAKAKGKGIFGLTGIEKASGKTKEIAVLLKKLQINSGLIVTGEKMDNVFRAGRNIAGVSVLPANQINAYEVLKYKTLLLTKEAVEKLAGEKK